jgi:putative hydrolase of HD superfamily
MSNNGLGDHMLTALEKQLSFLREIDRLKRVIRQSPLLDKSRKENSAEHSLHLAMYDLILSEYAIGQVDPNRIIRMLLMHDMVEIDVGDFPTRGTSSSEEQARLEVEAAHRLFGQLCADACPHSGHGAHSQSPPRDTFNCRELSHLHANA